MRKLSKIRVAQLVWIASSALAMLVFRLKRNDGAFMNAAAERLADPAKKLLASLSYRVSWSVMELVIALAVVAAGVFLIWLLLRLWRERAERRGILLRAALLVLTVALPVLAAADWLWGVYYYSDGLQEKSGIYAEEISLADLTAVTRYAAANLNAVSAEVEWG